MPEKNDMPESERRAVLASIARDESAYPRDRIAAVRALNELDKRHEEEVGHELDRLLTS